MATSPTGPSNIPVYYNKAFVNNGTTRLLFCYLEKTFIKMRKHKTSELKPYNIKYNYFTMDQVCSESG